MSPTSRIVSKLHRPLLGTLASALASGALLLWSMNELQDARQENAAARLRKQQMAQLLSQATAETGKIGERTRRFQQLQASGVIGKEQHQHWTTLLENIQREREPLNLTYELGTRTPLTGGNGAIQSFATRLQLDAELRHEADLLELIRRLDVEAGALADWQSCRLARQEKPGQGLRASCEISLITLRPPEESRADK